MITAGSNGDKSITVEYTFTPPGGTWNAPDNGTYVVVMQASQVFDTDGPNAVPAGSKGSFKVAFPAVYTVDNIGDTDDGDYTAGQFTLREAMKLSNLSSPTDTIAFSPTINGMPIP